MDYQLDAHKLTKEFKSVKRSLSHRGLRTRNSDRWLSKLKCFYFSCYVILVIIIAFVLWYVIYKILQFVAYYFDPEESAWLYTFWSSLKMFTITVHMLVIAIMQQWNRFLLGKTIKMGWLFATVYRKSTTAWKCNFGDDFFLAPQLYVCLIHPTNFDNATNVF